MRALQALVRVGVILVLFALAVFLVNAAHWLYVGTLPIGK